MRERRVIFGKTDRTLGLAPLRFFFSSLVFHTLSAPPACWADEWVALPLDAEGLRAVVRRGGAGDTVQPVYAVAAGLPVPIG